MRFVKWLAGSAAVGAAILISSGLPATAAYIVTLEQVGSDVVATGSGTIDLASLSFSFTGTALGLINPIGGTIVTGPASVESIDIYTGVTGPTSFGSGGMGGSIGASSGGGDMVGINGAQDILAVPPGYASNSALLDNSTYAGQTFTSLGVTPGTYEWTWGTGTPDADSFTLIIGAVPAPLIGRGLPVLLAVGGALFGAKLLERRKTRRLESG
jgi:hypothetical protein